MCIKGLRQIILILTSDDRSMVIPGIGMKDNTKPTDALRLLTNFELCIDLNI